MRCFHLEAPDTMANSLICSCDVECVSSRNPVVLPLSNTLPMRQLGFLPYHLYGSTFPRPMCSASLYSMYISFDSTNKNIQIFLYSFLSLLSMCIYMHIYIYVPYMCEEGNN